MISKLKKGGFNKYIILILSVLILVVLSINFHFYMQEKYATAPEDEYERIKYYAVQCYASEGFYPPSLDYLVENYNLVLKEDQFLYFYDAFSSNIMPDIMITEAFDNKESILDQEQQR